ncbi:MAG: hypothetical protein JF606_19555 [Burkholderiales bacterium]|nr:hypothetical protein [Burkholderiales bacterium]
MSQSLIIALAVSFVVAFLEWRILSKIHGRTISSMREHYRAEARVAAELLSQCRHQISQLKSDLSNATALSARLSFKVVSNSSVPHAQENDILSHRPHPPTIFQPTEFQPTVFADTTVEETDRRMLG